MRARGLVAPLLVTFTLFGCAAAELPDKPMPKPYELAQRDFPLKSGLRVVVQEDHSAPVVAIVSTFNVGSTADPPGKEGLAHFVEHLAFRTKFADGVPIMDRLKHMGAQFNATTWWDFTNYFSTVSKDYLEELMQQEAWRIAHIIEGVTQEAFTIEREVVRNELRLGNETSIGGRAFDLLGSALYPVGHPMHRPTIGTHASLDAITLDDVRAWVKKHYRPENCTIVVAGDVDPKFVGQLLGTWPTSLLFGPGGPQGPAVPRPPLIADQPLPPVPEPVNRTLMREKGPISSPTLMLAWSAPAGLRRNDALLSFVANRLNLAFDQGIQVKEDDDLEGVGASVEALINGSMFVVQASLRPGADPERARTRILDALVQAWTTEFGIAQTEYGRWYLSTSMLLETSDLTGNAVALGQHVAATGSPHMFKDEFDALAKIKPGEIADIAYKYLKRDRAVSLYIEPETDQVAKLVGGGGSAGGGGGGSNTGHQIGREPAKMAKDLGPSHILKIARSPGLAKLPRWKLPNGLEVVAARQGTAPVASVMVGLRGGDAFTKPFGLASYASDFAQRHCFNYGTLDAVGGQVGNFTGLTSSTFFVSVLSGNLANGVAVLADNLSCLEVNEEAFLNHEKILERRSKVYERLAKMPDFVAGKRLWAELYPEHPYGVLGVDPMTLKTVSFEDAAAFVRSHYRPGNAVAVVIGDVDAAQTKALTDKYLSNWSGSGSGVATLPAPPPPPTARKAFLVDRPKATQATVRIACRLSDATADQLPLFDLAASMANQRAWSVREEWGASYGVYASVSTMPGGATHMMLGGAITTEHVGKSVQRLLGILSDLDANKIDEKYFLQQRWEVAREFQQRFTTGDRIARAIVDATEHGWPIDVWDKYPERLAAASRHDVRALMKNCVGREIITVAGDAAKVGPQLKAIGLKLEAN
jgi:zinc protease